jgi:PPP family 3-phenylpropionic acid transporter
VIVQAYGPASMLAVYTALLAGAGISAAALLGRGRRPPRASGIGPLAALRLLRQPAFGLFFIGSVVVWIAATGVMAFFSLRLVELGGDARLVGLAWGVNALAEVPVMLAFRRLARRVGVERLLVAGALVFAGRAALYSLTGSAAGLVLVAGIGGPGFALYLVGTIAYVSARAPAHLQATAQALFSGVAFALGNIIGAVLAGIVAERSGLAAVFPVAAVASLAGAALIAVAVLGNRALDGQGPDAVPPRA